MNAKTAKLIRKAAANARAAGFNPDIAKISKWVTEGSHRERRHSRELVRKKLERDVNA